MLNECTFRVMRQSSDIQQKFPNLKFSDLSMDCEVENSAKLELLHELLKTFGGSVETLYLDVNYHQWNSLNDERQQCVHIILTN